MTNQQLRRLADCKITDILTSGQAPRRLQDLTEATATRFPHLHAAGYVLAAFINVRQPPIPIRESAGTQWTAWLSKLPLLRSLGIPALGVEFVFGPDEGVESGEAAVLAQVPGLHIPKPPAVDEGLKGASRRRDDIMREIFVGCATEPDSEVNDEDEEGDDDDDLDDEDEDDDDDDFDDDEIEA